MTHVHGSRLIYAADTSFERGMSIKDMTRKARKELSVVCKAFEGLEITIKGNTIFRLLGASAFTQLHNAGCRIFGDYKLFDVQDTCDNDGSWLANVLNLDILTVNADVHPDVFTLLSERLPNTIICPVKPLTDLGNSIFIERGEISRDHAVSSFFSRAMKINCTGIICSPKDLDLAPDGFQLKHQVITPGIRPIWSYKEGDTNAVNALTPFKAIKAGANRLVVGSPVRKDGKLRENALRILDEIGEALAA